MSQRACPFLLHFIILLISCLASSNTLASSTEESLVFSKLNEFIASRLSNKQPSTPIHANCSTESSKWSQFIIASKPTQLPLLYCLPIEKIVEDFSIEEKYKLIEQLNRYPTTKARFLAKKLSLALVAISAKNYQLSLSALLADLENEKIQKIYESIQRLYSQNTLGMGEVSLELMH